MASIIEKHPDFVIIGGGVIGLSLADCALREKMRVAVLDKGAAGQEASWAGAGMLTCRPWPRKGRGTRGEGRETGGGCADYHDLTLLSVRLHEQWAQRLYSETGIDVGYRQCGALELLHERDLSAQSEANIQSLLQGCQERGVRARRISASEARRLEPALTDGIAAAIEFPDEAQVRNPRFLRALLANVRAKGGEIREGVAIADIEIKEGRASGVVLSDGQKISAGAVAVCAGAWAGQFPSLTKVVPHAGKVHPVRGQILCYETDPKLAARLLTCGNHYIVPRGDGILLVGATHEHAGFDKSTTAEGLAELEAFGHSILPELKKLKPVKSWAGLRPGMKGKHPLIGAVADVEALFVAFGHYRSGLTLAPATAELLIDIIFKRKSKNLVDFYAPCESM